MVIACHRAQEVERLETALLRLGVSEAKRFLPGEAVQDALCEVAKFLSAREKLPPGQRKALFDYMVEVVAYRIVRLGGGLEAAGAWYERHESPVLWKEIEEAGLSDEVRRLSRRVTEILS